MQIIVCSEDQPIVSDQPEVDQAAEEAGISSVIMQCLVPVEPIELAVMAVRVVVATLHSQRDKFSIRLHSAQQDKVDAIAEVLTS